jgi:hypothetical protein
MGRESLASGACLWLSQEQKTKSLEPRNKKPLSYTPAFDLLLLEILEFVRSEPNTKYPFPFERRIPALAKG